MVPSQENPIEKANDIGVEALKQIITLSSAILALTITFLKDALGDARSSAIATFLVPLSWFLMVSSIWAAWIAIVEVAKTLGAMDNPLRFVFDRDVEGKTEISDSLKKRIQRTRRNALIAQWSFLLGIASLTLFALINWGLFFTSNLEVNNQSLSVIQSPTASTALTETPSPTVTGTFVLTATHGDLSITATP